MSCGFRSDPAFLVLLQSISCFICFRINFLIHGLFVFRSDENVYLTILKRHRKIIIFTLFRNLCITPVSVLLLFRSYIGPFSEVNNCESGDDLSIVCGLEKSPEDIVITPDNKYLIISALEALLLFMKVMIKRRRVHFFNGCLYKD